jgi:hypothetical protein
LVCLVRPINSSEDYNQFTLGFSASPTINVNKVSWHPTWYAYAVFQNYKSLCADFSMKTLNKPYVTLVWQNTLVLPKNFRVNANMQWACKGDYNNYHIIANRFNTSVGVQHDFNLRQLGTVTADLRCNDIFNTDKSDVLIYGVRELTAMNPARRTFALNLTWKFNEARSKYRGSGAGEKQKARM